MDTTRAYWLLEKLGSGKLTAAETDELYHLLKLDEGENNENLVSVIAARIDSQWNIPMEELAANEQALNRQLHIDAMIARITSVDVAKSAVYQTSSVAKNRAAHRVHFLRQGWFRYAAAILIIFGIGAYLYTLNKKTSRPVAVSESAVVQNDVPPGSQKAILTLSDGKTVELNNAASETIQDQTLSIENKNGQLIYKKGDLAATNTMTTPRGGQYQLTLADGTRVWLNAASSITYPTAFTGYTREVSISGEAYFEVAKNVRQPFHVKTNKEVIEVLGTAFNVSVYDDEPASKIALAEGAIKIGSQTLKPGQALLNGKIVATDITKDIAWKNGRFGFHETPLKELGRQLERWYDITISYPQGVPVKNINGSMGRNLTLSEAVKVLNNIGINCRMENRILVVLPSKQ